MYIRGDEIVLVGRLVIGANGIGYTSRRKRVSVRAGQLNCSIMVELNPECCKLVISIIGQKGFFTAFSTLVAYLRSTCEYLHSVGTPFSASYPQLTSELVIAPRQVRPHMYEITYAAFPREDLHQSLHLAIRLYPQLKMRVSILTAHFSAPSWRLIIFPP